MLAIVWVLPVPGGALYDNTVFSRKAFDDLHLFIIKWLRKIELTLLT